jgi:uncharacterized phage protein (TIGR01671 family)
MNRKIKFRAWIKAYKIMVKVERINFDTKTIECYLVDEEEGDMSEFSFDEIGLMRYTSMEGKNGVEIYEGDIVNDKGLIKIIISKGYCFAILGKKYDDLCSPLYVRHRGIEVIGNIYENKGLLGGESA